MNEFEQLVKLLDLYPHNINIARKIGEAYDSGATRVSVIQDTGTGKTYLGLYVGAKFRTKKIKWLVPYNSIKEHVETTIFSNPNISNLFNRIDLQIITYSSLINMTEEELAELQCELLIVDELHHIGAPVWGERVRTIVNTHPHITLFGMSAYKVRERGTVYERDVTNPDTDEIFSGTVVSEYDRYDAIIDGVLAKPIVRTVITEDCDEINEIKRNIEILKKKKDPKYIEYQEMLDDVIAMIHQQDGIKSLVQQTVYPGGKYYYFCPVNSVEGKNDMDTIMATIMSYIREKYPNERIVFYKTTSADGDIGKKNRDCFYHDIDLEGKDASNAIRIMFAKNQYNEGVHAPGVNAEFLGRKTRSDIVAGELSGRVLSARGDIYHKIIEYEKCDVSDLMKLAEERGLTIKKGASKQHIIEMLIAPVIIDLADNISYFQEMETNLGYRIKERRKDSSGEQRQFEVSDSKISVEVTNKQILDVLQKMRDKLRQKTWDDWYKLVEAYFNHNGHSRVPSTFKTINGYEYDETGFNLGAWCSRQRKNQDALSQERRSKLLAIKFRFEAIETMSWEDWYKLVEAYFNHNGHSDIPTTFKTINGYEYDETGFNLGKWCSRQRTNQDALSQERRSKLLAIKFRLETIETMSWEDWYKLVEAYFNHNGHSRVPSTFKTINGYEYDEGGVSPGKWCSLQRHTKDKLTEEQLAKLEAINFSFELQKTWDDWYALAKIYYDYHKNSDIPKSFKTKNGYEYDAEGAGLGTWCKDQRSEQCTLTPEQITKLQAIKFRFSRRTFTTWETNYALAEVYFKKWGNLNITASFKTSNGYEYDENGTQLGRWLISQRSIAKKGGLTPEQRDKLKIIGFDFGTLIEMTWDDWYTLLEKYYKNRGHSDVPAKFKTVNGYEYDEAGQALGTWCNNQRQHQERLTPGQRAKLDALNFRMESKKEIQWNEMYDLAKAYFDFYGHSDIPTTFKTTNGFDFDPRGKALGSWISEQRKPRKKITPERKNKLDLIGFRFCVMEEHQEKIMELCNEYGLDVEKHKILSVISYQELYAKIKFLLDNNMTLQADGELHPIFGMSNTDMKNQYGISKEEIITNFYLNMKRSG